MSPRMKLWIVSALFVLLALPTAAFAQRADNNGQGRGDGSHGQSNGRGQDNGHGRNNGRGQDNGHGHNRPVIAHPTRPPHGPVAPVPEPTAALVFAGGLLAARYAVRRRS